MKKYDVMVLNLDTIEIEASTFDMDPRGSLRFVNDEGEAVAQFATGCWTYVKLLTAEEIAENEQQAIIIKEFARQDLNS